MVARLRQRRSRTAVLSSRLAMLAVPVLVVAAIGHQLGRIDDWSTMLVAAAGFGLAVLAILAAIIAFAGIWQDGRKGFASALWGFLLGLLLLAWPAMAGIRVASLPWLPDVSTDPNDPPLLVAARAERPTWARSTDLPDQAQVALQEAAFPNLQTRRYGGDPARIYAVVLGMVKEHGWRLLDATPPDGLDEEGGELDEAEAPPVRAGPPPDPIPRRRPDPADVGPPVVYPENVGMIEAVAPTTLFGFPDDIAIRLRLDEGEMIIDMRSASRFFAHDLGSNPRRIASFMTELDSKLAGLEVN